MSKYETFEKLTFFDVRKSGYIFEGLVGKVLVPSKEQ